MANDFKCICCPYGGPAAIAVLLGLCAYVLTLYTAFGCGFFYTTFTLDNSLIGADLVATQVGQQDLQGNFGLWNMVQSSIVTTQSTEGGFYYSRTESITCAPYPKSFQPDATLKAARAMSMIAFVIGTYTFIMICLFGCCLQFPMNLFIGTGAFCLIVALFVGLSLIGLASKWCQDASSCTLGPVSYLAMAACVLWITLGLYIFLMPKTAITDESRSIRMPSLRRSGPQPTKVTTIHQAADGTKKITTTITNPDGSKTVTEEVEPAA